MDNIFEILQLIGSSLLLALAGVVEFLNTPISSLTIENEVIQVILDVLTVGGYSLWENIIDNFGNFPLGYLFLGGGLSFVLIYNFIKWVVGLITGS